MHPCPIFSAFEGDSWMCWQFLGFLKVYLFGWCVLVVRVTRCGRVGVVLLQETDGELLLVCRRKLLHAAGGASHRQCHRGAFLSPQHTVAQTLDMLRTAFIVGYWCKLKRADLNALP